MCLLAVQLELERLFLDHIPNYRQMPPEAASVVCTEASPSLAFATDPTLLNCFTLLGIA